MSNLTALNFCLTRIHLLGIVCVLISLLAWISDWSGVVYACPYCRLQRTVIGILGVLMIFKGMHNWILAYVASVIGYMGLHVAAAQHFMGWKKINSGTFSFNEQIYIDPFLLSAGALFLISAQVWLLILSSRKRT